MVRPGRMIVPVFRGGPGPFNSICFLFLFCDIRGLGGMILICFGLCLSLPLVYHLTPHVSTRDFDLPFSPRSFLFRFWHCLPCVFASGCLVTKDLLQMPEQTGRLLSCADLWNLLSQRFLS